MTMPTRLKEVHVTKVSLVPAGAHQEADVELFKSDDSEDFVTVEDAADLALIANSTNSDEIFEKIDPSPTDVHTDGPLGKKRPKAKKSEAPMAKATTDSTEVEKNDAGDDAEVQKAELRKDAGEVDFDSLPDDVKKYIDTLEDVVVQKVLTKTEEAPVAEKTEVAKADEAPGDTTEVAKGEAEESEEDLLKSADPRLADLIRKSRDDAAAANKAAAEATKVAKFERDQRVERELIAKADTFSVPGDKSDVVAILKSATATGDAELIAKIDKLLAATTEVMKQTDLFKEIGTDQPGGIESGLEKVAKALIDTDPKLTKEQAIAKALEANPELYNTYLAETKGQ